MVCSSRIYQKSLKEAAFSLFRKTFRYGTNSFKRCAGYDVIQTSLFLRFRWTSSSVKKICGVTQHEFPRHMTSSNNCRSLFVCLYNVFRIGSNQVPPGFKSGVNNAISHGKHISVSWQMITQGKRSHFFAFSSEFKAQYFILMNPFLVNLYFSVIYLVYLVI
jgi:hypothetical protein